MTVRVYRSNDAGAPQISSAAGGVVGVLDACLVNGYSGRTPAGWTIAYTGTNLRAYRMGGGNQRYMCIQDNQATNAYMCGFEAMTAVTTGTGRFPTVAQQASGGPFIFHSTTNQQWIIIASETFFYFWMVSGTGFPSGSNSMLHYFGDFPSLVAGDTYNTICGASNSTSSVGTNYTIYACTSMTTTTGTGIAIARPWNQTGTAALAGMGASIWPCSVGGSSAAGLNNYTQNKPQCPDNINFQLQMAPVHVIETAAATTRGTMPGMWNMNNYETYFLAHQYQYQGPSITFTDGPLNGKTIESFIVNGGRVWLETSNTW